jgi:preprotein translocase subunit YajC
MPPPQGPSPFATLLPLLLVFVIFYVLVFQPQAKARKDHEHMLKQLKKHDEVVTSGGIFGTILNVKPDAVTLRVDENVRLEVEKSAIARLIKPKGEPAVAALEKKA